MHAHGKNDMSVLWKVCFRVRRGRVLVLSAVCGPLSLVMCCKRAHPTKPFTCVGCTISDGATQNYFSLLQVKVLHRLHFFVEASSKLREVGVQEGF